MKKICGFLIILSCSGCGKNESDKMAGLKESDNEKLVHYPLPKSPDSLVFILAKGVNDTNKINVLNSLGWQLKYNNIDTAIQLGEEALEIAEKLLSSSDEISALAGKRGVATSYGQLGVYYRLKSDYPKALDYFFKALKLGEELNNKKGIAIRLGNIGSVYHNQSDYPKALENYFKALKMAEELGNKQLQANNLGNLGLVYNEQMDYTKSLEYFLKALKMDEEIGDRNGVAADLGNIGSVYYSQVENSAVKFAHVDSLLDMALEYYFMALKMDDELGNKDGVSRHFGNIGNVYDERGQYADNEIERKQSFEMALDYYFKALRMDEELENINGFAAILGNIGSVYIRQEKYRDSFDYLYRAIVVADSIKAMDNVKSWYEVLSTLYEKSTIPLPDSIGGKLLNMEEMRLRALHYFKAYLNLRDTLFSEENKKQLVQKEMNYEFDKKQAALKAGQDKKDALAKAELSQKEKERNYFIAGFVLVAVLAGFIFRGYRQKQKANAIISHQKELVEEKQKEILDSIQYARRIQQSLLPSEKYFAKQLKRKNVS